MPGGYKKTDREFREELALLQPTVIPKEPFTDSHTPVLCECSKCGYQWKAQPANLTFKKNPTGCPKCSGTFKKTTDEFIAEMAVLHPDIEVVGEYKNSHEKILCRCLKHDVLYDAIPTNLLRRHTNGCRLCFEESSESKLAAQLKKYCLSHYPGTITEYRDLKNPATGRYLPYDIFIPNINNSGGDVYCEVMGQQHYRYIPYFSRNEQFYAECRARDYIKESYAKCHGRYVEVDIREIKTVSEAVRLIEGEDLGWIAKVAYQLPSDVSERTIDVVLNTYG